MTNKRVGGDLLSTIDLYFVSTKVQHPKRQRLPFLSLVVFTPTRKWLNAGVGLRKYLTKDVLRDHLLVLCRHIRTMLMVQFINAQGG